MNLPSGHSPEVKEGLSNSSGLFLGSFVSFVQRGMHAVRDTVMATENHMKQPKYGKTINGKLNGASIVHNISRVIVNAYYRGGSTLLGNLIKFNPHSFYLFEPFTKPFRDYKQKTFRSVLGDIFVDSVHRTYR